MHRARTHTHRPLTALSNGSLQRLSPTALSWRRAQAQLKEQEQLLVAQRRDIGRQQQSAAEALSKRGAELREAQQQVGRRAVSLP
jgi:hypothetical protein